MTDEKALWDSKKIYNTLLEMLDSLSWSYKKKENDLKILTGYSSYDYFPMDISVDCKAQVVSIICGLPFVVNEDNRAELAMAVTMANAAIVDGCFIYNILNGELSFKATIYFKDSDINPEALKYLLIVSCNTVDHYSSKLQMVDNREMTLDQFDAFCKE